MKENYKIRTEITESDPDVISGIVSSTGFFSENEISIARELAEERLLKGPASGYNFIFLEKDEQTVGYTCFGKIPGTQESFDLYWIAVHNNERGNGIGKILLDKTEQAVSLLGGKRIYIETSGRDLYLPTRKFYINTNCKLEAELKDFYAPGDSKFIYLKLLI